MTSEFERYGERIVSKHLKCYSLTVFCVRLTVSYLWGCATMNKVHFTFKITCFAIIVLFCLSSMLSALCCSIDSLDGLYYKKLKDKDDGKFRKPHVGYISLNHDSVNHPLSHQDYTSYHLLQPLFGFSSNDINCIKATSYKFT